ncbi:hypothetical protein CPB86DRAFT_815434 [Serendipita vermifera]|nr:hypothetical protein CPB86DRAFT_815434 [Serendipita vermifera]
MTAQIRLWLHLNSEWIPIISIPREEFVKYTTRPLKWLRYVGSTVYGQEGILKGGPNDPEIGNYMAEGVYALLSDYFYYSAGSPRLVAMNMINKCTSPGVMSPVTTCSSFDDAIFARDDSCVITGVPDEYCEGTHIIPRRRGDAYIEALTRSRADSENDVIRDINDPRNGILLEALLERLLRRGDIAFISHP